MTFDSAAGKEASELWCLSDLLLYSEPFCPFVHSWKASLDAPMATVRRFRPDDLNKLAKCNLDPLTETYELGFYLQYYAKWPSLFQVAEDQYGNIIGYSMPSLTRRIKAGTPC